MSVDPAAILRFAPGVKFRFDDTRQAWIVLAPERLFMPDEHAAEILKLVDGQRTADTIIDDLAKRFDAPRDTIAADVLEMLQDLVERGVISAMSTVDPPLALLAELTHRCPLQCPYCSNPRELVRRSGELDTATWQRVLTEAAKLGVLQVHFSGGEPTARRDLEDIVRHASQAGLYTNLITSAVQLGAPRVAALAAAGLDHVQISFQDADDAAGDEVASFAGAQAKKRAVAALVVAQGLPLTANLVVHRRNLARLPAMIDMAVGLGAARLEVAHVQYYGWALANRAALLPTRAQLETADGIVAAARARLKGRVVIDYVMPDYYARRPKACMSGWGRRFINITPEGKALPCHAAETLPGIDFPSVATTPLATIWRESDAFQRFRGTAWMPEPCRSCDQREIDWGGCRCQALALTGDATRTDPVCALAPDHARIDAALAEAAREDLVFRKFETA